MNKERRYLGLPLLSVQDGKLASKRDVLQIIFSYNKGNMRGFKFSRMHCPRMSSSSSLSTVCRDTQNGCIARGELCIFQKVKANWDTFPCISDVDAIKKIERLKMRYDANVILKGENTAFVEELEKTFQFELPDFKEHIMSDHLLSPEEKTVKLNVLLDYIGPEATRSAPVLPEGAAVQRRREREEHYERERAEKRDKQRKGRENQVEREQRRVQENDLRQGESRKRGTEAREERARRRAEEELRCEDVALQQCSVDSEVIDVTDNTEDEETEAREKANRLQNKKEESEKGIAVMIPTNLQEMLTPLAVVETISDRDLEMLVAGVYRLVKPIVHQRGGFQIADTPGI